MDGESWILITVRNNEGERGKEEEAEAEEVAGGGKKGVGEEKGKMEIIRSRSISKNNKTIIILSRREERKVRERKWDFVLLF